MKGRSIGRHILVLAALIASLAGGLPRGAQLPQPIHERNVAIPMRDGVQLRADILRSAGIARFPTLVYRTPYGKDAALKEYATFRRALERGYAVVVQDVRGRYASDGDFRPYEREGRDGYDTIEWAARQEWSNGRVGTFGLSYPGAVQWLAAIENPPHLVAMVPAMTFSTPQNFFFAWGIPDLSWITWIWWNIAPDTRARHGLSGPATRQQVAASWAAESDRMLRTLPLNALAELRDVAPYYYDWLRRPPEDPFWSFAELRGKYGRTRAAVLNLSGWHDDNYGPEGAITNFLGLMQARGGQPLDAALLMGPWVHGVSSTAKTNAGDLEFGPDAAIDYDEVVLDWMDRHVRGDKNAPVAEPVRYFVMGANRWYSFTREEYVNPRIVQELLGWISDSAESVTQIDLVEANQSNRFHATPTVRHVGAREWVTVEYGPREGFFAYRYIATSPSGVHMLHCRENLGGSSTFHTILLATLNADKSVDPGGDGTQTRERVMLKSLGSIVLGDRYDGEISYDGKGLRIGGDQSPMKHGQRLTDEIISIK